MSRPLPPKDRDESTGGGGTSWIVRAAQASWIAPVLLLLGFLSPTVRGSSPALTELAMRVLEIAAIVLPVVGVACGVVALAGVRRHGARRILAPAVVGLALSIALGVIVVWVVLPAFSRARAAAGARLAPVPAPITSPQSALRQTGWMGYSIDAKFSIMVIAMDDRSADTVNLKSNFDRDCTVMIVSVDNRPNAAPIAVTTDGASVRMADNSVVPVLQTREAAKA